MQIKDAVASWYTLGSVLLKYLIPYRKGMVFRDLRFKLWVLWHRFRARFGSRRVKIAETEPEDEELLARLNLTPEELREVVYGENLPDVEINLELEAPDNCATSLRVIYHHWEGSDVPLMIKHAWLIFNVDPSKVPKNEYVTIGMRGKDDFEIDLSTMLAAAIGWEMTNYAVMKATDLETATKFDHMIMWHEHRQELFLPTADTVSP